MKGIKTFRIIYQEGKTRETREWPAQSREHALKRFQRARELSNQGEIKLISVTEIRAN